MAGTGAGVMARKALRTVSAMRSRASNMSVRFDGPVNLLAISVEIIVIAVVAIERRSNVERTTQKPNGYQCNRGKSHLNASKSDHKETMSADLFL